MIFLAELDREAAVHLRAAVEARRRWCITNGYRWPDALSELARLLAAPGGRSRSSVDACPVCCDGDLVQPMALPYDEARRLVGVSEKTLRRWVAAGELPVVEVGGVRLIRPADLEEFLDNHKTRRNGAQ